MGKKVSKTRLLQSLSKAQIKLFLGRSLNCCRISFATVRYWLIVIVGLNSSRRMTICSDSGNLRKKKLGRSSLRFLVTIVK